MASLFACRCAARARARARPARRPAAAPSLHLLDGPGARRSRAAGAKKTNPLLHSAPAGSLRSAVSTVCVHACAHRGAPIPTGAPAASRGRGAPSQPLRASVACAPRWPRGFHSGFHSAFRSARGDGRCGCGRSGGDLVVLARERNVWVRLCCERAVRASGGLGILGGSGGSGGEQYADRRRGHSSSWTACAHRAHRGGSAPCHRRSPARCLARGRRTSRHRRPNSPPHRRWLLERRGGAMR